MTHKEKALEFYYQNFVKEHLTWRWKERKSFGVIPDRIINVSENGVHFLKLIIEIKGNEQMNDKSS